MDELNSFISKILPSLTEETLRAVLHGLDDLGVEHCSDLVLVEEQQLTALKLKPIHIKKLLAAIQPNANGCETYPDSCTSIATAETSPVNEVSAIRTKRNELIDLLECQYGLLTELFARGILTDRHLADIRAKKSSFDQNEKLIEILFPFLMDKLKYEGFLESLQKTDQGHLAIFIADGDDQLNANRPLTLAERHKIRTNSKFFEEYINLEDGLLDELFAADVISNYHKQSINASKVPFERNQRLLSIIERRGVVQYKQFLQCLRITRQGHVAQVLETDGVVTAVDVPLNRQLASRIVEAFDQVTEVEAKKQIIVDLLGRLPAGVELVGMKNGHSIRLFFLCHSLEALHSLRSLLESGELITIIALLFNLLLSDALSSTPSIQESCVYLQRAYLVDYCKCKLFFMSHFNDTVEQENRKCDVIGKSLLQPENRQVRRLPCCVWKRVLLKAKNISLGKLRRHLSVPLRLIDKQLNSSDERYRCSISFSCLNADVLELLLLNVFLFRYKREWLTTRGSSLYELLASVSLTWRTALKRKSLLRRLRQTINEFYRQYILHWSATNSRYVYAKNSETTTLIIPTRGSQYTEMALSLLSSLELKKKKKESHPESKTETPHLPNLIPVAENVFIDIDALDHEGYNALFIAAIRENHALYQSLIAHGANKILPQCLSQSDLIGVAAGCCNNLESMRDLFSSCYRTGSHDPTVELMYRLLGSDCELGSDAAMALLKEYNIDINSFEKTLTPVRTAVSQTALHVVVHYGKLDVVKCLLRQGADLKALDSEGRNVLHIAADAGHLQILKYLLTLEGVPDITATSLQSGYNLFHCAATGGDVDMLQLLVNIKCFDLKKLTREGETALHIAARSGTLDAVIFLLSLGLDINAVGCDGRNILHTVAVAGQSSVLKYLLDVDSAPDIASRCSAGFSLFHSAAVGGNVEILKLLAETKCFDLNDRTLKGETALHIATRSGKLGAVKYLIKIEADTNLVDNDGRDMLLIAAHYEHIDILVHLLTTRVANRGTLSFILHEAAHNGNIQILQLLLQPGKLLLSKSGFLMTNLKNVEINVANNNGETPLHVAARRGNVDAARFLILRGADRKLIDKDGENVLHKAAQCTEPEVLKYFLTVDHMPDIIDKSHIGFNVFHYATVRGNVKVLQLLSEAKVVDINGRTDQGETALLIAACSGELQALQILLQNGADMNIVDNNGWNALQSAARFGQTDTLKLLLTTDASSNVNTRSHDGQTLLHHAAYCGDVDILKLLISTKSDFDKELVYQRLNFLNAAIDVGTSNGSTALFVAIRRGKLDAVRYFVECGADIYHVDSLHRNMLHIAAEFSDKNILTYLLSVQNGPDSNSLSARGWNLLHHAAYGGNNDILQLLLASPTYAELEEFSAKPKFDVDCITRDGDTSLHIAAQYGAFRTVQILLENGADINLTNNKGFHAISIAEEFQKVDILKYLQNWKLRITV